MVKYIGILWMVLAPKIAGAFAGPTAVLTAIVVDADRTVLNPVLEPDMDAHLRVWGVFSDGSMKVLPDSDVVYDASNKLASDREPVVVLHGDTVLPGEGGLATITAVATYGGHSVAATLDIIVRPYYREYHQTLVLKLFMGMEGVPVPRLAGEMPFRRPDHDVLCTFAQALDVIHRTDNLTRGIPKIIYLVGWQKGGHDHGYPSWDTVNPRLKRPQDSTALESLRWLIRTARQYHTTVSLHINMVDAYKSSPLWQEYVQKDVLGRDTNGRLLARDIQIQGDSMYIVSYTREWEEGLAQRRIDRLIAMVPELREGHTIHIDAFIDKSETEPTLSPWHAMPAHGGIDIYKEAETQHKIFKYWRARGFDVTGEGLFWAHPPGEGFYGLQPMSWWYPAGIRYQMETPECLSARGGTDRHGDGDFRFGNSMHGEDVYMKSLDSLPDFLGQFCRNTLPWYYLSRLRRLALIRGTLYYSGGVHAGMEGLHKVIRKGDFVLRDNDDLFVPALWLPKEIIAYSRNGYAGRSWVMPEDWKGVERVDVYRIAQEGLHLLAGGVRVADGRLALTLEPGEAVAIQPAAVLARPGAFGDQGPKVIDLSAYGVVSNSQGNASPAIARAIEDAERTRGVNSARGCIIQFPGGRVDLWPEGAEQQTYYISNATENDTLAKKRVIGMLFKNLSHVTLEGNHTLLVYHGKMTLMVIDHCRDVTVKDLSFDFERPTMSEMTIESKTDTDVIADVRSDSWYAIEKEDGRNRLVWYGEGWRANNHFAIAFEPASEKMSYVSWRPFQNSNAMELSPLRVKFEGNFGHTVLQNGDILTVRDSYRDEVGVFNNRSRDVRFENLNFYYIHGLGIVSQLSGNILIDSVRVAPKPGSGRVVAAFADCFHFSDCYGLVKIENSLCSGSHDDPVNVHGTSLRIMETNADSLTVRFMHGQTWGFDPFDRGDSIEFVDHKTLLSYGTAVVRSSRMISEREITLVLEQPVPRRIQEDDCIEDVSKTPSVVIRNNRFEHTETRGLLVTSRRRVLIEGNTFFRTGMHAILIADDCNSWFESGPVRDVTIRNNRFLDCAYLNAPDDYVIVIKPETEDFEKGKYVHSNIRITGNRFKTFDTPVLFARNVNGLSFLGNQVIRERLPGFPADSLPAFNIEHCNAVQIR